MKLAIDLAAFSMSVPTLAIPSLPVNESIAPNKLTPIISEALDEAAASKDI